MGGMLIIAYSLHGQLPDLLVMEKIHEPVEKAFTILKPKGWVAEGGISRWDPVQPACGKTAALW